MNILTKTAWALGNVLSQIVFAFRHGYRNGAALRPGAPPEFVKRTFRE